MELITKNYLNTLGASLIPSGGHERQVLTWLSDGKAQWTDLSNTFNGMEEILAYGVLWNVTSLDPHITRIGNMSLHKTLPIQSQLKGCIAQGDKVIYWLNENDWRFRKDPIYMDVDLSNDVEFPNFGGASITDLGVGQFVKAGEHIGKIAFIEGNSVTVEWEEDLGDISAELVDITQLEIGSRLDGYDGTVRVYCPNFYIKSVINGDIRLVWISTVKIDNTWSHQSEILIDAYRSTVLNTVPANMGYLSTLPVNSAVSVVNTATYCRGGNSAIYDKYLTGADGTTIDVFRSNLGKPRTGIARATMRTYSRNAGSEMLSYEQYKNIFYWLWVIEYANFNSLEAYKEELTEDGFHQGGMGNGVTTINADYWNYYNGQNPLTPCGYCNELGNRTGIKDMVVVTPTTSGGAPTQTYTFKVCRWRGFDNPFGDIWTNLDGVLIDTPLAGASDESILPTLYVITDSENYTDSLTNILEKADRTVKLNHTGGWIKEWNLGENADMVPQSIGGNTSQGKCDYYYVNYDDTPETLFVGSYAINGGNAGLGYFNSSYGVSRAYSGHGFRSVSSFVSFSRTF